MYIHIVQENETVESIAAAYGASVQRIISDNGLFNLPHLVVGQALIILIAEIVHTVQPGETLYSIARMYGMTVIELRQKNPGLITREYLYVGEEVVITFQGENNLPVEIYSFVYPSVRDNVLRRALPYVSKCAVFGYGFREDGSLIPITDSHIIEFCYQFQTAPVLLLTSIDESGGFGSGVPSRIFNDVNLQNIVIGNLLAEMRQRGYTGLDIDFEYINVEDREAYISFVQNATMQMNENGFTVNVDLAPKTSSSQQGTLYEGHDYAALGAAANTVMVMSYEWGYTYGPPMAVAPLPQVRNVLTYAVSEIPPEKIYMGLPNYGYDWRLPYERGVTRARSIGNDEAIRIAEANNAVIQYDNAAETPYFEYIAADGSEHVVWFEDIRSIQKKFQLINELNLRGGGYWNLMRTFNQNWAYLSYEYYIAKLL